MSQETNWDVLQAGQTEAQRFAAEFDENPEYEFNRRLLLHLTADLSPRKLAAAIERTHSIMQEHREEMAAWRELRKRSA